MEPRFLDHAGQAEQAELFGDFTAAIAVVAMMNMEEILHGIGQGP